MDDMQNMSMESDVKLLSSRRAFDFDEPSERGMRKKKTKKQNKKPAKTSNKGKTGKTGKKGKKGKKGKRQNKSKNSKKPSKPSDFKSCEASCPTMDEMRASAMEEMKIELCVLNAIGWMDDEGNMKQDVEDADMAEFREAVSEAKIKDCAEVATAAKMEAMMKDKKFQKKYGACFENECYSEEDM